MTMNSVSRNLPFRFDFIALLYICMAAPFLGTGCSNNIYRVNFSRHLSLIERIAIIDIGEGHDSDRQIVDYITNEMISTGLDVIERSYLSKLLTEHDVNTVDFIDSKSIAEYGKMLGVDAIAMHKIMEYEEHDSSHSHEETASRKTKRTIHIIGFLRFVDVEKARIVLSVTSNFSVVAEHKSEAYQEYALEVVQAINAELALTDMYLGGT